MNGQDRGQPLPHVVDGRHAGGDLHAVGQAAEPLHRVALDVRPVEHVDDVRDAVPVEDGDHGRRIGGAGPRERARRALPVETGRGRDHAGGQRQMAAGGHPGHDHARRIQAVLLGVPRDPAQRAQAVLHRGGRERDVGQAVPHVDDREPHLEIGQQPHGVGVLLAAHPAAAVDHQQHRRRAVRVPLHVEVELVLHAARLVIRDVGNHAVGVVERGEKRTGGAELGLRGARAGERQDGGGQQRGCDRVSGHLAPRYLPFRLEFRRRW